MQLVRENNLLPVAKAEDASLGFHMNNLSPLPQLPGSLTLADEYSKPAVMGQTAVSSGRHPNNPASIKEILISVLESYDDFKIPTEKCIPDAKLSSLTLLQSGEAKKFWDSGNGVGEQQEGIGIPMTTSKCNNYSLFASSELSSSQVISNTFNKLILSAQSTAARRTNFTGVPPVIYNSDQSHQHFESDVNIYTDKAQHCQSNRPEMIVYTSYLSNPSFSASKAQERENTHLIVADLVIATLENVKCNILYEQAELGEEENLPVIQTSDVRTCIKKKSHSDSVNSVDSGFECGSVTQLDDSSDAGSKDIQNGDDAAVSDDDDGYDDFVIIEFDDIVFGSDGPLKSIERHCLYPEYLARRLFKSFRTMWLPPENEEHHLDGVEMVLDKFLPLKDTPGAEESVDLAADFKINSRLRGTAEWAPPRFQILFFIHSPQKREVVMAAQNSLCAGCGTLIEPKYIKKLRYCEYLGKYFCECCHHNEESLIPGRILMKWDFSKHPVCHFSKQLLESIWHDPLFNIFYINNSLYSKVKELRKAKELQEQLIHIKKLLRTCRLAKSAMVEFWRLQAHLSEELHLYSLNDLVMVKKCLLVPGLKDTLRNVLSHVKTCKICMAKGVICVICKSKDIIFPFQTEQYKQCCVCKAWFHKECFKTEQCPRCTRICAQKELLLLSDR
ncbi:protein associated with UVRAG as autophagy enhancer isoform X1 [Amblyraja radiata]|uniref:protein associated with UVRAG as autophagy enhancer isoform X1 n=2 Tax=Amblyraja radiata TaxID=386614 RepID=UPI001402E612|nr:protein associated with UVRAG as autophagy enhancer isoform X1 [Amblyraja radiata]XP_032888739.1 protein associated with UVRAG as autophagy enhancer isoform X1 [Amblyraja radiata]